MTISIIIPVFNASPFLNQCIDAIIQQTFTDWECLLIDDGSTDGSGSICDEWASFDCRIRAFHQNNQGVSAARNKGLNECLGEYVCFIDADDWVEREYLEHLLDGFNKDKTISLTVSGLRIEAETPRTVMSDEEFILAINSENTSSFIENVGLLYGPTAKLFKASYIRERSLAFPIDISFGEDTIFVFEYLRLAKYIAFIPFADYHYRKDYGQTLSSGFRERYTFLRYGLWKKKLSFYKEKGMWNKIVRDNLYPELWSILYDGIYSDKEFDLQSLKMLLSIPEIKDLKNYPPPFQVPRYFSFGVTHRLSLFFFIIKKLIR